MPEAIKNRWVLLLVLFVFIIAKLPALHYPFYWDESWSYAPGVKLMYLHGSSLLPNAIDLFYSRGHPLLFYASAATWMHIFGDSHVAQHSFGLFLSVCLLVSIYEVCLSLFNKRVAIISLLLVASQVIFFVQSSMLLPEIMVALLALLSLYFYASQKHILTFLSLTALMFTKESGMTLGLVLGVHALWNLFSKKETTAQKAKGLTAVVCAGLVMGVFFLLQKNANGWYFYPEHTSLMNFAWPMFKGKLRFCVEITFAHQCRFISFTLLAILSVLAAVRAKSIQYAVPAIFIVLLVVLGYEAYFGFITRRLLIPVVFATFIYTFYRLVRLGKCTDRASNFIYLSAFFSGVYLSFSSINFFTDRYLMCSLVIFMVMFAFCFDVLLQQFKPAFFYAVVGDILLITVIAFKSNTGLGDIDLGAYSAMQVQQDVVNYCELQKLYDKPISAKSSLQRTHLTLPYTGFLSSAKTFSQVNATIIPETELIIIDNIEPDSFFVKEQHTDFKSIYRTQKGEAWAEIYGRK